LKDKDLTSSKSYDIIELKKDKKGKENMTMMKVLKSEYIKKGNKWVLEKESVENCIVDAGHWRDWLRFDKQLSSVKSELAINGGLLYYYITTNKELNERVKYKNLFQNV